MQREHPGRTIEPGVWIDVDVVGASLPRRGQVLEVLGRPGHERYRMRWDDDHESIHFPSDGTHVVAPGSPPRRRVFSGA